MANDFRTFSLAKQYGAATDIALGQQQLSQLAGKVQRGEQLRQSLSNLFEENPQAGPGEAADIALQHGQLGVAAQLYNADAALGKLKGTKMETNVTKLQAKRSLYQDKLQTVQDPILKERLIKNVSEIDALLKKKGTITGRTQFDLPKSHLAKLKEQDLRDDIAITQIKRTMEAVRQNPNAVGVWGSLVEDVGGLLGQIPGGIGEAITEGVGAKDITKVRTALYTLVGPLIPRITGDTSGRYSDRDMERVERAYAALKYANSSEQALASMQAIMETIQMAQKITRTRNPNVAPKGDSWLDRAIAANPGMSKDQIMREGKRLGKIP